MADDEFDLVRYFRAMRRRALWVIAPAVVLALGSSLIVMQQSPVYSGEARVLLQPRGSESLFSVGGDETLDADLAVATELQMIKGAPVRASVRKQLGPVPKARASRVADSLVVKIAARSRSPRRAAEIATAYARAYITIRREQAVTDVLDAGQELQTRITTLGSELDALESQIDNAPDGVRSDVERRLLPRRDALVAQQALLRQRMDELQVQAALKTGGARLVATAPVPREPVSPRPVRTAVLGGAAGLLIGLALAAIRENLDETIKGRDDLATAVPIPVLATIPTVPTWRSDRKPHLVNVLDTAAPVGEALRSLRTAVQLVGVEDPLAIIQIASAKPAEGKTTIASNVAALMARAGERVVVVDCDLRQGGLHAAFGLSAEVGLTSVLADEVELDAGLQPVAYGDVSLSVLARGDLPPNPSELLASRRMSQTLFELRQRFDRVILDSAPVLPVTDAAVLSAWVDGVVLVAAAGITRRRELQMSLEVLRQVDANVVGTVLNRAGSGAAYGYGYGYGGQERSDEPSTDAAELRTP